MPAVDVRDVAEAHIFAALDLKGRNDRFLIAKESVWYKDIIQILKDNQDKIGYQNKLKNREIGYFTLKIGSLFYPDLKYLLAFLNKKIEIVSAEELILTHDIEASIVEMASKIIKFD